MRTLDVAPLCSIENLTVHWLILGCLLTVKNWSDCTLVRAPIGLQGGLQKIKTGTDILRYRTKGVGRHPENVCN